MIENRNWHENITIWNVKIIVIAKKEKENGKNKRILFGTCENWRNKCEGDGGGLQSSVAWE